MRRALVCLSLLLLSAAAPLPQPQRFDVLIRNARVLDGSGNPWLRADLGISGDRIAAVGRLDGATAARTIDAHDRFVAPGFIDVHSHAGEGITHPPLRQAQPLLAQGVTTFVANPDGGGPVDLAAQRAAIEKGGTGPNVALLIGHGSVRRAVMGEETRDPTSDELQRMQDLVRRGMKDGAFGLSSGLFYIPGTFSKTEEVIALAKIAGEAGGAYTSHIRDEGNYNVGVAASVREVIRIAEEAHTVGIVSHMKALGADVWGQAPALLEDIEKARARGVQVFADQYPYEASATTLRAALLPGEVQLPTYADLTAGREATSGAERHATRGELERMIKDNLRRRGGASAILISSYRSDPSLQGKRLNEIADARHETAEATALELIAQGSPSIVSFNMSENDIQAIMREPFTMASSDGGLVQPGASHPHPRNYGAFARRLGVYVRERHVVGLEFAVRSMTSLPAAVFGFTDRGVIRPGAFADLVVFDPDKIRDTATYTDPEQLAEGVSDVLVNGVIVRADGKFTEALPGRVLRRGESR